MDLLTGLNPQQAEAVTHSGGPLLILAGAGSGKTRVITHRMAYLIQNRSVSGPSILAVTFTNKASGEMRDRVMGLVRAAGASSYGPMVSTFHSFCVRLLRRDGASLADLRPGFTTQFTIYDDDDQLGLIKQSFRHAGLDEQFLKYRSALSWISAAKNQKQGPEDLARDAVDPKKAKLAVVFEQYEQRLRQANALDFDDLLLESVRLLRHDATVRGEWNRRIEHLLIDEYQDTNRSQYDLMRLLSQGHANVCVVGDEDQSIYGWRGADIRNILDFESDYPNAKVIRLERNYRSTGTILKSASAVVARNKQRKGKNLWTDSGEGEKVGLFEAADAEQEALWIAETVEREIRKDPKARLAVLYRTNSQSRQIEEALRRYNRKYIVVGGFSFYQRAEVKDAMAYLKLLQSPRDSISLLRIINTPARGIGKSTMEEVERHASANGMTMWDAIEDMLARQLFSPRASAALAAFVSMMNDLRAQAESIGPDRLLRRLLDLTGYWKMIEDDPSPESESRLQNLSELVNAAAEATERGEKLAEFLDHAALAADSDSLDEESQVSLLTMHNAKGLEFPVVFVAGMEEGLFPHSRARDSADALEEERRLCYVAMTRAERRLYLSYARFRRRFGSGVPDASIPSRFLNEVPHDLVEVLSEGAPRVNGVDLYGEQNYVRETAKRNLFTGKTYNSVENISQFFADRGLPVPSSKTPSAPDSQGPGRVLPFRRPEPPKPKAQASGIRAGVVIEHPKYGRGTVLRKEGDGDDAKLTIQFVRHGLKKLVQKFAGITVKE
jgi:DNA helicase-2/ATP-dependent DNA helicase PcrA